MRLKLQCRCGHVSKVFSSSIFMREIVITYKDLTRNVDIFEVFPWFKFNNLEHSLEILQHFAERAKTRSQKVLKVCMVRFFKQRNGKNIFFVIAIYEAENFTLALPLHEKNE